MLTFIVWYLFAVPSASDVDAFQKFAPAYLTTETAREHLSGARIAGHVHGIDPDLMLAIAWYESRYTVAAVGPAVSGKRACGVMQPLMHGGACPAQTLVSGYLEGAEHLRTWLDTKTCHGNLHCALLGYAGGYALLKRCGDGPVPVERGGRSIDLCRGASDVRIAMARRIQWLRRHSPTT